MMMVVFVVWIGSVILQLHRFGFHRFRHHFEERQLFFFDLKMMMMMMTMEYQQLFVFSLVLQQTPLRTTESKPSWDNDDHDDDATIPLERIDSVAVAAAASLL